ncbi:MAG TPA: BON domain-containing protein [Myxococcota bacterium]|nr:BON domain-containing protein [Myxococcota bacterium]
MGYEERRGHGFERWERNQPSRSDRFLQRREPRERPFGDENFGQEREDWREPQDIQARERFDYERGPQWGRQERHGQGHAWGQRDWSGSQREWGGPERDRRGRFTGVGPKGYRRSDERIREDACQALCDHPDLDATDIEVLVKNGEVTLQGTVSDRHAKRLAEEALEDLPGVQDVRNELRMNGARTATHSAQGRSPSERS